MNHNALKRNTVLLILMLIYSFAFSQEISNSPSDAPIIEMNNTIANPGEIILQIDALNFIGDNGQISAITLNITIDTFLINYIDIQNTTIQGSWLGNYNIFQNHISISFVAPMGTGYDINGKLLELVINYTGGFPANLDFNSTCEITNINLQTIQNVVYNNALVDQLPSSNIVKQDSVSAKTNHTFLMPVIVGGPDYDSITAINLRMGYNEGYIVYSGYIESAITGVSVVNNNGVITINWDDNAVPHNFTTMDTLLFLNFIFTEESNTIIHYLPGSRLTKNGNVVGSNFFDGVIQAEIEVVLLNQPDTAGTTIGSGYYLIYDSVVAIAIPEVGFYFENWIKNDSIVETDSIYIFVKNEGVDTVVANYLPHSYEVNIIISPILSGFVSGQGYYLYGDTVIVSAIPVAGYEFTGWFLNGQMVSSEPDYTFIMPYNRVELTAVFQPLVFNVFVSPNNTTFGETFGGGQYNYGDTTTIKAIPAIDYCFVAWTENGQFISSDSNYSFTVYRDYNFVGNFEICSNCMPPVGLFADNFSETEATLFWTPSGDEAEWDIIWGEHGFDTTSPTNLIVGLSESTHLLENLNPGTYYDFYVRAKCSESSNSSWSVVSSFSTWYVDIFSGNSNANFLIYPIPASNRLIICSEKAIKVNFKYSIVDLNGINTINGVIKNYKTQIDISKLTPGIYCIIIFNEEIVDHHKFIKQ